MSLKISKKFISRYLLKYLPVSNLGRKLKVGLWRIIKAILYKLKTGCQWRELPMKEFCGKVLISCGTVFYHYNNWSKQGCWKNLWEGLLEKQKSKLDMSSVQLDGSHSPAKRGGEEVGYQARKKCKTSNALFLTDRQGIPLAMSVPVAGQHHDLFEIEKCFTKMLSDLQQAQVATNGLFLNADAGFDSLAFRTCCKIHGIIPNIDFNKRNNQNFDNQDLLDDELYKERFSVERTNAWIDAFKTLLVRFETTVRNWQSFHYIAFSLILIRSKTNHF